MYQCFYWIGRVLRVACAYFCDRSLITTYASPSPGRLLTIYTRSLPLDIASRLWDWYLLRGEAYLFQAGLGLLHHLEGRIVRQDWDANMYDLTHTVPAERLDEEEFFDSVQRMHVSHAEFVRVTSMSANHAVSGVSVATSDAISSAVCDAASPGTARADKSDTCADVSLS